MQGPFSLEHAGELGALRRTLDEAGYVQPALAETVAMEDHGRPLELAADVRAVLRRTEQAAPRIGCDRRRRATTRTIPRGCWTSGWPITNNWRSGGSVPARGGRRGGAPVPWRGAKNGVNSDGWMLLVENQTRDRLTLFPSDVCPARVCP